MLKGKREKSYPVGHPKHYLKNQQNTQKLVTTFFKSNTNASNQSGSARHQSSSTKQAQGTNCVAPSSNDLKSPSKGEGSHSNKNANTDNTNAGGAPKSYANVARAGKAQKPKGKYLPHLLQVGLGTAMLDPLTPELCDAVMRLFYKDLSSGALPVSAMVDHSVSMYGILSFLCQSDEVAQVIKFWIQKNTFDQKQLKGWTRTELRPLVVKSFLPARFDFLQDNVVIENLIKRIPTNGLNHDSKVEVTKRSKTFHENGKSSGSVIYLSLSSESMKVFEEKKFLVQMGGIFLKFNQASRFATASKEGSDSASTTAQTAKERPEKPTEITCETSVNVSAKPFPSVKESTGPENSKNTVAHTDVVSTKEPEQPVGHGIHSSPARDSTVRATKRQRCSPGCDEYCHNCACLPRLAPKVRGVNMNYFPKEEEDPKEMEEDSQDTEPANKSVY